VPHLATYVYFLSIQLLNEPGLGAGINPGMALTPFPSTERFTDLGKLNFPMLVRF